MGRKALLTNERVLAAVRRWTATHDEPPTVDELVRELGVASTRTVFRYLQALHLEGAVERRPGAEGVRLAKSGLQTRAVPVIGRVAAGTPILAEENVEGRLRLPLTLAGPASDKVFLLHVHGTSMNAARVEGDSIDDGDLILVRQQPTANDGDIVVALIDGEATVKRLARAPGYIILKPESKDRRHQPIMVERDFRVLGKVKRVLKQGSRLVDDVFDDEGR